jgi:hypothetical protein
VDTDHAGHPASGRRGRGKHSIGELALVTLTMALADGLFVAQETGEVELAHAFDLLATAILGSVEQIRANKRARES